MNRRWMTCLIGLMVAAAGGACGTEFSATRGEGGSGAGSSSTSGPGGGGKGGDGVASSVGSGGGDGGDCKPGELLAPEVPGGWEGPYLATGDGEQTPNCDGVSETLYAGLVVNTDCSCECDENFNNCVGSATLYGSATGTCDTAPGTSFPLPHGQCVPLSSVVNQPGEVGLEPAEGAPNSPACSANKVANLPLPYWSYTAAFCLVGTDTAGCTPQQPGYDASLCVVKAGDGACPDDYPNGCELGESFSDSRSCDGSCECGGGDGLKCDGAVTLYGDNNCQVPTPAGGCFPTNAAPAAARYMHNGSGQCTPGGNVQLNGEVEPSTVTVCCTKPNTACPYER